MSSSLAVIVCKHEKTGGRKTGLHPGRLRLLARESVVAASIYEKNGSLVPEDGIFRRRGGPGKNLAMGDIRVFGLGRGKNPATGKGFTVVREADERNARISWKAVKGAQGYNVLWGVALDKLYSSWMVYGDNSLDLRALTVGQKYYFAIEAFNENGISQRVFLREAH